MNNEIKAKAWDQVAVRNESSHEFTFSIEDQEGQSVVVIRDPMEAMDNDKAQLETLGEKSIDEALKAHIIISQRVGNEGNEKWNFDDVRDSLAEYLRLCPEHYKRLLAEIEAEQEPEHAFPESDDELVGEMFENERGTTLRVYERITGPDVCDVRFYCKRDGRNDRGWHIYTNDDIRACKPLGPSPEKRKRLAMERVCAEARCLLEGESQDDLEAAIDALAKVEGESDE